MPEPMPEQMPPVRGAGPEGSPRLSQWRVLLRYAAPARRRVAVGGAFTFTGTLIGLSQPLLAQQVLASVTYSRPVGPLIALLGGLVLAGAVLLAIGYYLLESAGETVVLTMRTRLIDRILRLRIAVTEQIPPGDLLSRLVSDTTLLRQITSQGLVSAVTGVISLIGSLVLMGILDWVLLLVTMTAVLCMTVTVRWSARRIGRATGQAQAAVAVMASALDRSLGAFRTVKAAGAVAAETARLTGSARGAWELGLRLARWQAVSGTTAVLTLQVSFLVVLGVGGARVAAGTTPVSDLIAFMLFMLYLNQPITALSTAYGQYQAGLAAATRVEQVLALPAEPSGEEPPAGAVAPPMPRASVRGPVRDRGCAAVDFQNVMFSYSSHPPWVHDGVTFSVPPGRLTAVVGPSGAGKSTLFALVERFYDVTAGRVLVDGRDVRDWPLDELRAAIGYVEQDTPALAGTLRDNLTLGLGQVSDERLGTALTTARLDEYVARLPDGLDSEVGYRGGALSGGERQRLSIARALLRAPRLLLLDEVTSHLDAANERALRDSIATAAATTTVMVVAHRLSTVVEAGQIVVLDSGRVRACGTHAELLACDALYRALATTQLLAAPGG
jgi:ABC-type multidrug transport system fused ATPase/permease subunit